MVSYVDAATHRISLCFLCPHPMSQPQQETITKLLDAARTGDRAVVNDLFPLVYDELRAMAQRQRRNWHGDYTINTTALVHEAYIKLADQTQADWKNRAHFFGVAARAMRQILIDYARKRSAVVLIV